MCDPQLGFEFERDERLGVLQTQSRRDVVPEHWSRRLEETLVAAISENVTDVLMFSQRRNIAPSILLLGILLHLQTHFQKHVRVQIKKINMQQSQPLHGHVIILQHKRDFSQGYLAGDSFIAVRKLSCCAPVTHTQKQKMKYH